MHGWLRAAIVPQIKCSRKIDPGNMNQPSGLGGWGGPNPLLQKKTLSKLRLKSFDSLSSKPSNFGSDFLKKFGWKEGEGLGKRKQGIKSYLKVSRKDNKHGIGCDVQVSEEFSDGWWTRAFEAAASRLKSVGEAVSFDNDTNSSDSESSEMEDTFESSISLESSFTTYSKEDIRLFRACKGRQLGKRAGTVQIGKIKREELANQAFDQEYTEIKTIKLSASTRKDKSHTKDSDKINSNTPSKSKLKRKSKLLKEKAKTIAIRKKRKKIFSK